MQRSDWLVIGIVLALDLLATIAISLLTVLAGGPVWLEFVLVLAMFVVTLVGAYWVLFAPEDIPEERKGISKEGGGDGRQ
jgi:hypothetical protein